jgi:hypothetical protein
MHSDEKPRFLKLFPLSGNPIASYGESVRLKDHQPYYPMRVGIGVVLAAWVFGWAVSAGAFNILATNDDGIHAEGLAVLASELSQMGNVFVVAPD